MAGDATSYDDLKLHLRVFDEDHEIAARARIGRTKVLELLPLARRITDELMAISIEKSRVEGLDVSCRKGCTWCCHQLVPLAPAEAVRLAEVVEAMPREQRRAVKKRFEKAVAQMERAGLVDARAEPGRAELLSAATTASAQWDDASGRYYRARIPCPFLEDGGCTVYAERPMVCREYYVTTPAALCEALDAGIRGVPRAVRMGEVMTDVTNAVLGRDDLAIPLPLALEWASVHGRGLDGEGDGEELAMELVRCIQEADDAEHAGAARG